VRLKVRSLRRQRERSEGRDDVCRSTSVESTVTSSITASGAFQSRLVSPLSSKESKGCMFSGDWVVKKYGAEMSSGMRKKINFANQNQSLRRELSS
jgi:hypothetical protein